jgi:hypothetical protein
MLRLVLLLLYLAASFASPQNKIGGGLDPNGFKAQSPPTADSGGGLDPDGRSAPKPPVGPTVDAGGGWDPNG